MKTAGITFMRANPPTAGHFLIVEALHNLDADKKYIYLSHSQDSKKNPLDYNTKAAFLQTFVNEKYNDVSVKYSDARTIIDVLVEVNKEFDSVIIIVGSDRVDEFKNRILIYNGHPTKQGFIPYKFENIEVISVGEERNENGDFLSSMSATKQRELAKENNFEEFRKGVPTSDDSLAYELFKELRKAMKIT